MEINQSSNKKTYEKESPSQENLLLLLDNNPVVTAMIDSDGKVVYLNPLFVEVTGYQLEDIPTISVFNEKAYPDAQFRSQMIKNWQANLRNNKKSIQTAEMQCNDGSLRNIEVHSLMLPNRQIIMYARDYTDQKRAESLLLESEARFKALSEASFEGLIISENGYFLDANQSAARMVGYSYEDMLGMAILDLIAPESRDIVEKHMSTGYELPYEAVVINKNADRIPVEIQGKMFTYLGRQVRVSSIRDLSERYRNQEEISRQNTTLQALFYNTPDAVVLCENNTNRVLDVNPRFVSIFGYSVDECRGRVLSDLVVPEELLADYENNIQTLLFGRVASMETRRRDKTGHIMEVALNAIPISNYGYYVIYEDISERKQAEKLIQEQMRELEAKNAEMERFTYTVSHDLRSPLITIKGFSGMLLSDINNGKMDRLEKDIQRIINAANKMEGLLEDLLALSRVGRMLNPFSVFSMSKVSLDVAELLNGVLQEHGVHLTIDENMPEIKADEVRIREVLQNLVENAIKFMGDQSEPKISIGYYSSDNENVFFVKDNGLGIESRYYEKIFGLFDKLETGTEGTGIGLALVKRIIEFHHGQVWVQSDGIGCGSTFYFSLPALDQG